MECTADFEDNDLYLGDPTIASEKIGDYPPNGIFQGVNFETAGSYAKINFENDVIQIKFSNDIIDHKKVITIACHGDKCLLTSQEDAKLFKKEPDYSNNFKDYINIIGKKVILHSSNSHALTYECAFNFNSSNEVSIITLARLGA